MVLLSTRFDDQNVVVNCGGCCSRLLLGFCDANCFGTVFSAGVVVLVQLITVVGFLFGLMICACVSVSVCVCAFVCDARATNSSQHRRPTPTTTKTHPFLDCTKFSHTHDGSCTMASVSSVQLQI